MKTKLFSLFVAVFLFSFSGKSQTTTTCPAGNPWPHCISLMGPGTPNGNWSDDNYLTSVDGDVWTAVDWQFSKGEIKFRQDGCWDGCAGNPAGWGPPLSSETGWPTGQNTAPVPFGPNIQCPGGVWNVKFTLSTQSWEFTPGTPNPVISLVGSAVPGSPVEMTTTNGKLYTLKKVTLVPGTCQFKIVDATGTLSLGGTTFPNGSALNPDEFIPVSTTGIDYDVTFNYETAEYTFKIATFPGIAIVGAGAGGWPTGAPGEVDANQMTTTDGETYTISHIALTTGGIKFRQDNAWNNNWGGQTFPTGPDGTDASKDIPAVGGNYNCTFTKSTGAYAFTLNTIAIVGSGAGGWPTGASGEVDANVMSTVNGIDYTLDGLVLTDGGIKFRENNAWATNWGGLSFPTGPTDAAKDIVSVAGTYNVTFNRASGAYDFKDGLGVKNFTVANLKTYPNPTRNTWNITSSEEITSVKIYDISGKSVYTKNTSSNEVNVNAAKLSKGVYFAKVSTANGSSTVKLVKE